MNHKHLIVQSFAIIIMLIFTCCTAYANTKPLVDSYNYTVYDVPPFGTIKINDTITCPDPTTHSALCSVPNQVIGSVMTITGLGSHVCYLAIEADGSVTVDETRSVFCVIYTTPASSTVNGFIRLQKHF